MTELEQFDQMQRYDRAKSVGNALEDRNIRLFLRDYMVDMGIDSALVPHDQLSMAYNEGRRAAVIHLRDMLYHVSPESLIQMERDALNLERERSTKTHEPDEVDGHDGH